MYCGTEIVSEFDFRDVEVPAALFELKIKRKELEDGIRDAAERFLSIDSVDGPVEPGDILTVEYPNEAAEGGRVQAHFSAGHGFFSAQAERALMGTMRGETRPIPFPGRTRPLTVLKIKRRTVPAFTDELARRLDIEGVATVREYRQYLLDRLARRLRQKREDVVSDYVTKRVLENTVFSPVDRERGVCAMTAAMFRDQARGEAQRANAQRGPGGSPVTELDILRGLASVPDTATEGEVLEAIAVRCEENAKLCALGMSAAARDGVEYPVESIIEELRAQAEAGGRTYEEMKASTGVIPELLAAGRYIDYFMSRITSYYSERYTVTVVD